MRLGIRRPPNIQTRTLDRLVGGAIEVWEIIGLGALVLSERVSHGSWWRIRVPLLQRFPGNPRVFLINPAVEPKPHINLYRGACCCTGGVS